MGEIPLLKIPLKSKPQNSNMPFPLYTDSHCAKLIDNVLPTLNLPIKSYSSKTTPRSTAAISKREESSEQDQIINVQEALILVTMTLYEE